MKTNKRKTAVSFAAKMGKRLLHRVRVPEDDRARRTRLVYVLLSVGTVVVAYLLVLLNYGVFGLTERNLYGNPAYETVTISAGAIADPLSRSVRVELYKACTRQGDERAALPEERSKSDALAQVKSLWEQTLSLYAEANGGSLKTGESVDRVLRGSKYTARLRDFYNEQDDTKIAIWSAQAYYTASDGRVYCLSAELDSRVQDVYSITVALYDSIDGSEPERDFLPMLDALGESGNALSRIQTVETEQGEASELSLSDGICILRYTQPGVQYYLTLN